MAEPTPAVDPAEIEAGAEAIRRANPHAAPQPTEAAEQVLRAVLPDHDAQVRVPLLSLIADLADDGPCHYDHNGYCQAHSLDPRPCPHERAKRVLARQHATGGDHHA